MDANPPALSTLDRQALLALWAVPGVGPAGLAELGAGIGQRWGDLLSAPPAEWAHHFRRTEVRERLLELRSLSSLYSMVAEQARSGQMEIAFRGDPGYPARLAEVANAPPLLFRRGLVGPPRRRVAMVGMRYPTPEFFEWARAFASGVASRGVGVVSGAASGVDRACHLGALDVAGETWAFLGSALDEVDPTPARLVERLVDAGGVVFTELPPGVRASEKTFPPRNRLISGASDAVVVLRAAEKSGSFYTAQAALKQRRPLLAVPGEAAREDARGTNAMLAAGTARACISPEDVLWAAGVMPGPPPPAAPAVRTDPSQLSAAARTAYAALSRQAQSFEDVQGASRLAPGALASALTELELLGLVLQGPGKQYERV